ncbi:ubiquinone anaerobic biosynthesis accessory factor UbiT [Benzoatithermus flavus]|uniref:SCP2 sterol-binding domain-containing protein n=1 Tax=Benzoatithermus flavus TaxID=3108223 RepID=A0ABU8XL87_9PROT
MASSRSLEPPLSPVLLAGLVLRPLPLAPLQMALDAALGAMRRRHPAVFEKMAEAGEPSFLIDAIDLPLAFRLHFRRRGPRLLATRSKHDDGATATVRGPFRLLLALLEGRLDGDALFFSRELIVEGDTEAVLALRNAVDGTGIELVRDLPAAFGPLAGMAGRALGLAQRLHERLDHDLGLLQQALTAPLRHRQAGAEARLARIEQRLEGLARSVERRRSVA